MKKFKSEFVHSYSNYSFGYCNYALKEKNDLLHSIYNQGYLPYSGIDKLKNPLYMARSARVDLKKLKLNSENRRILKKFDNQFERKEIPLKEFDTQNKKFIKFCLNYFKKRHGEKIMPKNRLETILEANFITDIVVYKNNINEVIAYVFEVNDEEMSHFWFSFFDLDYAYKSLGMWLMIDIARKSKNENKKYFYVGTVYGEKALYKTNFDFLEYWNGNKWINDKKKLKQKSRKDFQKECKGIDEWKEEA